MINGRQAELTKALETEERGKALLAETAARRKAYVEMRTQLLARQQAGETVAVIAAEYDADTITLRLNSRYLEQFLEACETDKVHLFVKDEGSQCQGRPAEPVAGLKSYLYVVMPMRV